MTTSNYHIKHVEDKQNNILIREFSGVLTTSDILTSWSVTREIFDCTRFKGVVTDLNNATVQLEKYAIAMFLDFFIDKKDFFSQFLIAPVYDGSVISVALYFEYNKLKDQYKDIPITTKAFAIRESAIEWIKAY